MSLKVTCGDAARQVRPGSIFFLPRGVSHGFVAGPEGPARTLLINAVAEFGDVVVELGTRTDGLELRGQGVAVHEPARIGAVSAQYRIEQLPSPAADR